MKLRIVIILLFLMVSNFIFSQHDEDIIVWETDILQWKHYPNLPQEKKISQAKSNLNISSRWKVKNLRLNTAILAEFHKSKSFLKGKETEDLLKHEQVHFDITEYNSRLFRKELATYKFKSFKKIRNEMSALNKKYFLLSRKMQKLYDLETNHSLNKEQQKIWNLIIEKLLEKTSNFSNSEVVVDLSYLK